MHYNVQNQQTIIRTLPGYENLFNDNLDNSPDFYSTFAY